MKRFGIIIFVVGYLLFPSIKVEAAGYCSSSYQPYNNYIKYLLVSTDWSVSMKEADGVYNLTSDLQSTQTSVGLKTVTPELIVENEYCKVSCLEKVVITYPTNNRKLLPGAGFTLPVRLAQGERACMSCFDKTSYSSYGSFLANALLTAEGNERDALLLEQKQLLEKGETCSGWTANYSFDPTFYAIISDENGENNVPIKEVVSTKKRSIVDGYPLDNDPNIFMNLKRVIVTKEYEFADHTYVSKYSGNISTTKPDEYVEEGSRYYTGLATPKGVYPIKIIATNLGNKGRWTSTGTGSYSIVDSVCLDGISKYAISKYIYRPISVSNPFPNRKAGANWRGYESRITSNRNIIYSDGFKAPYTVDMEPNDILSVKAYNDNLKNYLDESITSGGKSNFINKQFSYLFK